LELGNTSEIKLIVENYEALQKIKYMVTGFYGLGLCGYLTSRYLCEVAEELGCLRRIGLVWSASLPPIVEVNNNGTFNYPVELCQISDRASVLLFRYQVPSGLHVSIADKITDLAKKYEIILILAGGIDIKVFPSIKRENADIVYTSNSVFKTMLNSGAFKWDIEKSPPGVVVSGGIAIFLMFAELKGVPAVSLLAPTYAQAGYVDSLASLKLAKRIAKTFDFGLDLSPFDTRIQLEVSRLMEMRAREEMRQRKEERFEPETEEFGIT